MNKRIKKKKARQNPIVRTINSELITMRILDAETALINQCIYHCGCIRWAPTLRHLHLRKNQCNIFSHHAN